MMLHGVTSFSRIKTFEIHVNAFSKSKVISGISFHVMEQNLKYLEDILAFRRFLYVRVEIESC